MCSRFGVAWRRYFSPYPYVDGACQNYEDPFTIDFGTLKLLMMDTSASLDDPPLDPAQIDIYREQFRLLAQSSDLDRAWLLTHHPVWGLNTRESKLLPDGTPSLVSQTLMAAMLDDDSSQILVTQVAVAGHVHNFSVLDFGTPMAQFIVGNGGALLDPPMEQDQIGRDIGGRDISRLTSFSEFGFTIAELGDEGDWDFVQYDSNGTALGLRCSVDERSCSE